MRAHEWVFESVLNAHTLHLQRVAIQVYDDGTMTAIIEPASPESSSEPDTFKYYVMDGAVTWRDIDGELEPRCRCRFQIMRFSPRLREGQLIDCEAELLPLSHNDFRSGSVIHMTQAGYRPCLRLLSTHDMVVPASAAMELVEQSVAPSISPLVWRLTPGCFVFNGFTCAVSKMLYECRITLHLAQDGTLSGFSEDKIHTVVRKSKVHGSWSAEGITFQLFDLSGDAPHTFTYSLTPHPSGMRGYWHEQVTQRRGYFQEGHVELVATSVERVGSWSPTTHNVYPIEFQTAAQQCVNLSNPHQKPLLPLDVWNSVLSNCTYDWF